ncbi:MAG: hypothetical protein ACYTFW_08865 [Planctomycetota bacterium]
MAVDQVSGRLNDCVHINSAADGGVSPRLRAAPLRLISKTAFSTFGLLRE